MFTHITKSPCILICFFPSHYGTIISQQKKSTATNYTKDIFVCLNTRSTTHGRTVRIPGKISSFGTTLKVYYVPCSAPALPSPFNPWKFTRLFVRIVDRPKRDVFTNSSRYFVHTYIHTYIYRE